MATRPQWKRYPTRRRRSRSDLLPISGCQGVVNVAPGNGNSCDQPLSDSDNSWLVFAPANLYGNLQQFEGIESDYTQKLSRGLKFRGMQFDLNITSDILFEQNSTGFIVLTSRWALCVIDLDPETGAPMFTVSGKPPINLFNSREMSKGDILWRAQFMVPVLHTAASASTYFSEECPCFDHSLIRTQHQRVRIRTRRNLKEHQALAFVVNTFNPLNDNTAYVFDLFGFAAVRNWV